MEETLKTQLKLVMVGNAAVGKTSLIERYMVDVFKGEYTSSVFDQYKCTVKMNNNVPVTCTIHDTGGQNEYADIRKLVYMQADVIILCFALNDRKSFNEVKTFWIRELKSLARGVPILLVGTKVDTRFETQPLVNFAEGLRMCQTIKARNYVECSSRDNVRVSDVFNSAMRIGQTVTTNSKGRGCVIL